MRLYLPAQTLIDRQAEFAKKGMSMNIGIIGSGRVGGTLGRRFVEQGHDLVFGVRSPQSAKVQALISELGGKARAVPVAEVSNTTDIVFLTTPWGAAERAIASAGDLTGKIVVDCTNPIGADGLVVGMTTSAGELVARWATGASVVKAFNTTGSGNMANPQYGDLPVTMFICGDDADSNNVVGSLAKQIGFDVVDTGPLKTARYLEPLAMLWVHLAYNRGFGVDFAFRLIRRSEGSSQAGSS